MNSEGLEPQTAQAFRWNWPGARWWRCDFHVHTPASPDFDTANGVTAEGWVAAAVEAGLDAVAVTDHNTGGWIERVQRAAAATPGGPVVFPGVELTVEPRVHLLFLFDPQHDGSSVAALLGQCGITGAQMGQPGACARCSVVEALNWGAQHGALCIAAHIDEAKGVLRQVDPGQALMRIVTNENLAAAEVRGWDAPGLAYLDNSKDGYRRSLGPLPLVAFSDGHSVAEIGQRCTWFKMTRPSLEGLRLALQDGAVGFDHRDEQTDPAATGPNVHGELAIESLQIGGTRHMGQPAPFEVRLNPWLNAIIGGRGSGKSSLVEFLRVAMGRRTELPSALRDDFDRRCRVPASRHERGLLTDETVVAVVYRKDRCRFAISWAQGLPAPLIEQQLNDGSWQESEGHVALRFPVRIYSQRQIYELSRDPEALLQVVDEAPEVDRQGWDEAWNQEQARFLSLRAQARELNAGLDEEPRIRGHLADVRRRLSIFEEAGHSAVLQEFQHRRRQGLALQHWEERLSAAGQRLRQLAETIPPPVLDYSLFRGEDGANRQVIEAVTSTNEAVAGLQQEVRQLARRADELADQWQRCAGRSSWAAQAEGAEDKYTALQRRLSDEGAGQPDTYRDVVADRQRLEERLRRLSRTREELTVVEQRAAASLSRLHELRRDLTERRRRFLARVLAQNPHVRIAVLAYGGAATAEEQLRAVLGREGSTFERDIGSVRREDGIVGQLFADQLDSGRLPDEEAGARFERRLRRAKDRLVCAGRGEKPSPRLHDARFGAFLTRLPPEVWDRLACWFPSDSLRVSYNPTGRGHAFRPIEQGSPGQRTAALLAFLLSHGHEPLVLDQPEDDLDNHLIYELIVKELRRIKRTRQVLVVTHNANIVVNGDAELVLSLGVREGQTELRIAGGLQEHPVREEICRVMEGGREAFERRYRRIAPDGDQKQ